MQGVNVTSPRFQTMQIDKLWALYEEVGKLLEAKLKRERQRLERRLARLGANGSAEHNGSKAARRPYPKVIQKYQNVRYHESINNLTPADVYFGRAETIVAERERIKRATISNRRLQHQLQTA